MNGFLRGAADAWHFLVVTGLIWVALAAAVAAVLIALSNNKGD